MFSVLWKKCLFAVWFKQIEITKKLSFIYWILFFILIFVNFKKKFYKNKIVE